MDRIVLYEILKWNFKLSNVCMRLCKKTHRHVLDNKTLMNKLASHYQPLLAKHINFELTRLFLDKNDIKRAKKDLIVFNDNDDYNENNENNENDNNLQHQLRNLLDNYNLPRSSKIENILVKHNDEIENKRLKKDKKMEVILIGRNNYVIKAYTITKASELISENIISIYELQNLDAMYRKSTSYKFGKKEQTVLTLLNNFKIFLNVVNDLHSQIKEVELIRSSPNTSIKYFLIIIALLYIRYTFMK